jgi:suppressor for copper-sensitivity B
MRRHLPGWWLALAVIVSTASMDQGHLARGQFDGFGDGFAAGAGKEQGNVVVSAQFTKAQGSEPARLYITAEIDPGWHTFAITQQKGGPVPTKITLGESDQYKLLEETFTPSPAPEVKYSEAWPGLPLEEHTGTVTWYVPIEITPGVDPAKLRIEGKVRSQRCDEDSACLPPKAFPFVARLGPGVEVEEPEESPTVGRAGTEVPPPAEANAPPLGANDLLGPAANLTEEGGLHLTAHFTPPTAGGDATLYITADIAPGWHTYAVTQQRGGPVATTITLAKSDDYQLLDDSFVATPAAEVTEGTAWPGLPLEEHHGQVTWHAPIKIAPGIDANTLRIEGEVKAQRCDEENVCLPPKAFSFIAQLGADGAGEAPRDVAAQLDSALDASTPTTSNAPAGGIDLALISRHAKKSELTFLLRVAFAFLGGVLLNVMPCVLPVIGLKIMSFVQQSGQDRAKVFLLNLSYAGGIVTVFMLLALLAALPALGWGEGLGWGELFRRPAFLIGMICIIFSMGLSLLGVWEIPIPGFAGGTKAHRLASKEGVGGAFNKGILTTILATPCTGPFLGSGIAVSVDTPAYVTMISFLAAGLGMASPYLLIGAFPSLVRFLPKPGEWMDTFKQCTTIPTAAVIPTVALLIGLWAACWWIGRTPITADTGQRFRAWASAATFALVIGWLSFGWLQPEMTARLDRATQWKADLAVRDAVAKYERLLAASADHRSSSPMVGTISSEGDELPWQPYSQQKLDQLVREQKTVLVDFTADWCAICQVLASTVLNTQDTKATVDSQGVVPMIADWTNAEDDVEVTAMLDALGARQVPTLAIFPAGRPNEPIIVRGPYTTAQLAELLKEAGPSKSVAVSNGSAEKILVSER